MGKTCDLTVFGIQYHECCFTARRNLKTNALDIMASSVIDGYREPLLDVTVQIGLLPDRCIAVKNYSENEGLLDSLMQLGIVTEVVAYRQSGFVMIPVCRYDPVVLEQYCG